MRMESGSLGVKRGEMN